MESVPYNLIIKNRAHRAENMWAPPSTQNLTSFTLHNSTLGKNNEIARVFGCLIVEKNLKIFAQSIKKLLAKHKRFAFRRISDFNLRPKGEKALHLGSTASQGLRARKEYEKVVQSANPQVSSRQLMTICQRQVQLSIQKLVHILQSHRTQYLLHALSSLQFFDRNGGREVANQMPNGYELESNLKGNNGSRVSNKRKTTRTGKGEEVKENSHCNGSEFSLENQRLRNQLLGQDFQREQFTQKMHELLDTHEKFLLQGSTTTRGKKGR